MNRSFQLLLQLDVHYPLHAWPDDIAKYRGNYKVGWDVIRKQRFERMKKMGIIGP